MEHLKFSAPTNIQIKQTAVVVNCKHRALMYKSLTVVSSWKQRKEKSATQ